MLLTILSCTHFFTKQPQLIFAKRTRLLSTISISVILLNIILNIFLIKIYGLLGAAYSTFISGIIYAGINFYYAQRFVPIHWEKKKILFLYTFLIAGIVIVFIFFYLNLNYNIRLLLKILLVVLYIFLAEHFNIINKKTINNILSTYLKKMKTYQQHLEDTQSHQKAFQFDRKPVYNGSAIFPVFHTQKQQTRILFMGYWMVKKKINEIGLLVSLRNQYGELISRYSEQIINPAAKEIELIDLLKETNCLDNEFTGSIELEVFSSRDHSF